MQTNTLQVLFWNTNKKKLLDPLTQLWQSTKADVLILVENTATDQEIENTFRSQGIAIAAVPGVNQRFSVFLGNGSISLQETYSSERISIRRLEAFSEQFHLGIVHGVDKQNHDEHSQLLYAKLLSDQLRTEAERSKNEKTILIGDFNLNPFDAAMHKAGCFNADMTKKGSTARKKSGVVYQVFYNPMWSLLGDESPGPPGTYFHESGSKGLRGWNMLDQVIISRSAVAWFNQVRIIHSAGNLSLIKKSGRPNEKTFSDHLPILVSLRSKT